jgi:superfamily II DNA or RNA helicase
MGIEVIVLKGGQGTKARRQVEEMLASDGDKRVIVSTGKYAGEGFDQPRLDTLFLAMPISWKGLLQQYVGRLHRIHPAKRDVVVVDYLDSDEPMLQGMFKKRVKGYRSMAYEILEPSSARRW